MDENRAHVAGMPSRTSTSTLYISPDEAEKAEALNSVRLSRLFVSVLFSFGSGGSSLDCEATVLVTHIPSERQPPCLRLIYVCSSSRQPSLWTCQRLNPVQRPNDDDGTNQCISSRPDGFA